MSRSVAVRFPKIVRVSSSDHGLRIDRWLKKQFPTAPHSLLTKLMRKKNIAMIEDEAYPKKATKVRPGLRVEQDMVLRIPAFLFDEKKSVGEHRLRDRPVPRKQAAIARDMVVWEDEHYVVFNKLQGISTQGGSKQDDAWTLDSMMSSCDAHHLIHRLDKDTSGLIVTAKTRIAAQQLSSSWHDSKLVKKVYLAMCLGVPLVRQGRLNQPMRKTTSHGVIVCEEGMGAKKAVTDYHVMDSASDQVSLLAARPRTGRTHQIRVHLAKTLDCPIIGDDRYGSFEAERDLSVILPHLSGVDQWPLHLHSHLLQFIHPMSSKEIKLTAPVPKYFNQSIKAMGLNAQVDMDQILNRVDLE